MYYKLRRKLNTKNVRGSLSKSLNIRKNEREYNIMFNVENEFVEASAFFEKSELTLSIVHDCIKKKTEIMNSVTDLIAGQPTGKLKKHEIKTLKDLHEIDSNKSIVEATRIFKDLYSILSDLDLLIRHELSRIMYKKFFGVEIGFHLREKETHDWVSISSLYTRNYESFITMSSKLSNQTLTKVEKFANDGFELTLAIQFLDIAFNSKSPQNTWVSTTIALEVGIKEALIHLDPRLENIFLKINSPRLEHLYKHVLKDYTGHESPFYKDVQYGAKIRNMIVHKPEKFDIDHQHSIDYALRATYILQHLSHLVRAKKNNLKFKNPLKRVNIFQLNKYKSN